MLFRCFTRTSSMLLLTSFLSTLSLTVISMHLCIAVSCLAYQLYCYLKQEQFLTSVFSACTARKNIVFVVRSMPTTYIGPAVSLNVKHLSVCIKCSHSNNISTEQLFCTLYGLHFRAWFKSSCCFEPFIQQRKCIVDNCLLVLQRLKKTHHSLSLYTLFGLNWSISAYFNCA